MRTRPRSSTFFVLSYHRGSTTQFGVLGLLFFNLHPAYLYLILGQSREGFVFVVMNEDKKKLDWKPAFELFGEVSTWIIVPIVLALIVGKALDKHYGTDPWIFLGLTGLSFILSLYGIIKVVNKYIKKIQEQDGNK